MKICVGLCRKPEGETQGATSCAQGEEDLTREERREEKGEKRDYIYVHIYIEIEGSGGRKLDGGEVGRENKEKRKKSLHFIHFA